MSDQLQDQVKVERIEFASSDGTSTIKGWVWQPSEDPLASVRGVVQLVHGMAEHIERYDEFARFLASNGFVVCGHDQVGHGDSCDPSRWGCLPAANGKAVLVEDVNRLRSMMCRHLGSDVPYVVFGHSMGSFVTRSYISRHGSGLAGAIICGTGFVPVPTSAAGNLMARLIAKVKGADYKSPLLDSMGVGAYAKQVKNAKTQLDWLSYDEDNVQRYLADEKCGFMFSAGGYATVTALTKEVCSPACAERVPRNLPLLFISGDGDPVGSMGKGVEKSAQLARDAGSTDVTCTIYPYMRHEILNETARQQVFDETLAWIETHCL